MKKVLLVLALAMFIAGGAFAQLSFSAGVGGNFSMYNQSYSHPDYDTEKADPVFGGGFNVFFDATYVTAKVGMFFLSDKEENSEDFGYYKYSYSRETQMTYLSLGILGKFPINLGAFTLFPMVGVEYNMFLSGKYTSSTTMTYGASSTTTSGEGTLKRADFDDDEKADADMFLLQLGVGADFNIVSGIYLRPTLLWGIDLNRSYYEKEWVKADSKVSIFKHRLDIGLSVGIRF